MNPGKALFATVVVLGISLLVVLVALAAGTDAMRRATQPATEAPITPPPLAAPQPKPGDPIPVVPTQPAKVLSAPALGCPADEVRVDRVLSGRAHEYGWAAYCRGRGVACWARDVELNGRFMLECRPLRP